MVQLILMERVENLGELGQLVEVRPGYARNYLVPSGKAKVATPANIKAFEERREELERLAAERLAGARTREEKLQEARVTVVAKAGSEGKLFGSVGTVEIAAALAEIDPAIEKREVRLPDGPLRTVGEHQVQLHLYSGIDIQVQVVVEPEEATI